MPEHNREFYLGANTSNGFVSLYNQIAPRDKLKKVFVIKGGPGTGKSTIMRKIGEEFSKRYEIEFGRCSSDPDSLDAVYIKDLGVVVLDGTPPHPFEPKFPGALESIVNLYPFWNEKSLENLRSEIERAWGKCSACHEKACKYLSVAGIISNTNFSLVEDAFLKEKAEKFVERIVRTKIKSTQKTGVETVRFLSAVTPKGVNILNVSGYDDVYIIEDEYKKVSSYILNKLRCELVEKGHDFITCYSVISPFQLVEHIFAPKLKLAFLSSDSLQKVSFNGEHTVIRAKRFLDESIMKGDKQKLKFNNAVKKEMINAAVKMMREAKVNHDELEKLYVKNVDFNNMEELTNNLMNKIKQFEK